MVEFCDVIFKTRNRISGPLSRALIGLFKFFETAKLRFVRPYNEKYDIIVDRKDNEIVLKITLYNHVVVKSPHVLIKLDDVDEETRTINHSVNSMKERKYGRSVIRRDSTFKLYLSNHMAWLLREVSNTIFALVRANNSKYFDKGMGSKTV